MRIKKEWLEQVKQLGQTLHMKAIRKKTRVDQEEHMVWSAHLGLYTSQGMGVTSLSREPEGKAFIEAVHVLAQGLDVSYCAIAMNVMMEGAQVLEHRDARNETGSINAVLQWGDYDGGHLWASDGSGSKHVMEEKEKWYQFDAKATQHGVSKVRRGIRWSIILYQPGRLQQVTTSIWHELRSLGFPSCEPRANQVWHECHGGVWFLSWLGTEGFMEARTLEEWGYREIAPCDCPQLTRAHNQKYAVLLSWADPIEDEKVTRLSRKERRSIEASGFVVETSDIPRPAVNSVYMISAAAQEVVVNEQDADQREGMHLPEQVDPEMLEEPEDENMEADDRNWVPSANEQKAIKHCHDNLGHPTLATFLRCLKHSGVQQRVRHWVRHHFQCDQCARMRRPGHHLPAKHPATFATNQIVGLDTVYLNYDGMDIAIIHALDWGSGYHQAVRVDQVDA
eukprot:6066198-Amphidinium_carterae.1